jgi:hypothetical protein
MDIDPKQDFVDIWMIMRAYFVYAELNHHYKETRQMEAVNIN